MLLGQAFSSATLMSLPTIFKTRQFTRSRRARLTSFSLASWTLTEVMRIRILPYEYEGTVQYALNFILVSSYIFSVRSRSVASSLMRAAHTFQCAFSNSLFKYILSYNQP